MENETGFYLGICLIRLCSGYVTGPCRHEELNGFAEYLPAFPMKLKQDPVSFKVKDSLQDLPRIQNPSRSPIRFLPKGIKLSTNLGSSTKKNETFLFFKFWSKLEMYQIVRVSQIIVAVTIVVFRCQDCWVKIQSTLRSLFLTCSTAQCFKIEIHSNK